jgi:hypothetical protein
MPTGIRAFPTRPFELKGRFAKDRAGLRTGRRVAGAVTAEPSIPAGAVPARPFHHHSNAGWVLRLGLPILIVMILAFVPTSVTSGSPRGGITAPVSAKTVGAAAVPLAHFGPGGLVDSSVASPPSSVGPARASWPAVQVAFVVETTAYNGVYDAGAADPGTDTCASSGGLVCEEANGVPVLAARAGQIAQAIAAAHPGSNISFAMADFFASVDAYDDGDGSAFHVDVQNFTAAGGLQAAVNHSFRTAVLGTGYVYGDSDLSDNILHSSSITALYGALGTAGFNWATSAHHVVVLIGSTAPRAPGYAVNYSVSASDYSTFCGKICLSPTCEPAYNFSVGSSPKCEGWTVSQTSTVSQSIAWLAQHGGQCAASLGGNCTVDTISLYNGVTDPLSKQWPASRTGGGPNGSIVRANVAHILNASCDLAAATGGTWQGPKFFTCANGQKGNLSFVSIGSTSSPNLTNPSLIAALASIGLGAPAARHPGFNQAGDLLITDQFNNRVIEVNPLTKQIVWSFGSGNSSRCNPGPGAVIAPNDAERLAGGLTLIAGTGTSTCSDNRVIVVNSGGTIVWQYGSAGVAGNTTGLLNVPVFAIQLPNHDILIVDQANNRVIEVSLSHKIVRSYGPTSGAGALNAPNSAERLANGDLLIADENNNRVIQVNQTGHIVWQYGHGLHIVAFASRLSSGNTLIADSGNNRIVEINGTRQVVFHYSTNLSGSSNPQPNPTCVVELRGGDLLITDQFNDRVFVLDASRHIVFQYGMTNVVGSGFDQLNAPYSAAVIGDYTGVTLPPSMFR